jgi:hypothetical protein
MILTILVLPATDVPRRLTRAETRLVAYLHDLWDRQGDVLLFSMRRAVLVTGLATGDIQRGLARLARRGAVTLAAA